MRTTATNLKSTIIKKKLSSQMGTNNIQGNLNNINSSLNNKPLSSTLSSKQIQNKDKDNKDKLSQLKQKLQQQRQNMRKSGKRFKQHTNKNNNQIEIQTNFQQNQVQSTNSNVKIQLKSITSNPIKNQLNTKPKSTTTGISTDLYDFNSLKMQVQNKTNQNNKLFMKKSTNKSNQIIYAAKKLTAEQIINKNIKMQEEKKNNINYEEKKRNTINLMQLSTVIQNNNKNNVIKNISNQIGSNQNSSNNKQQKFVQITKKTNKNINNNFQKDILSNSKVFQSAIKQQKRRNKQIEEFLSQVQLQEFAQKFINLGYDQVQTLIQVQVDDLNQMMMRAFQQDKLMNLIKKYKLKNDIQTQGEKPLIDKPGSIHKYIGYRPKSAAMTTQPSQNQTPQSSRLLNNFNINDSTLMNKSSIFYSIGGSQWSLESQIRKACSGCFKITQQTVKRGECYYCLNCDPGEFELDFISLDESMVRQYQK